MARPTHVEINTAALLHNLNKVRQFAPGRKIMAMVKANAYGCSLKAIIPTLEGQVHAFGVASLEEAMAIRALGAITECVLMQGVFDKEEYVRASTHHFAVVIHQKKQLDWLIETPLPRSIRVWVKVNTGMHRLGFSENAVEEILRPLLHCAWVEKPLGLMTHLACADKLEHPLTLQQIEVWQKMVEKHPNLLTSMANSAAIFSLPEVQADVVRPGIMLYGISPFEESTAAALGLIPVMRFLSAISAIQFCDKDAYVGYGATWKASKATNLAIVPVGYGDGYPRHVNCHTSVWIEGMELPVVGRVSMDMLMVDVSICPQAQIGSLVELWGVNLPIEQVAKNAGTTAYELICQFSPRVDG